MQIYSSPDNFHETDKNLSIGSTINRNKLQVKLFREIIKASKIINNHNIFGLNVYRVTVNKIEKINTNMTKRKKNF